MVAKRTDGRTAKGTFEKGNRVAVGNNGGSTPARQFSRRIISRAWFQALTEQDPVTQKTMADRLIRKACRDGLLDANVAMQVLKESGNRIEGQSLLPIVSADVTEAATGPRLLQKGVGAAEASRVYFNAIRRARGEDVGDDDPWLVDEIGDAQPALPAPDYVPRSERKGKVQKRPLKPDAVSEEDIRRRREEAWQRTLRLASEKTRF